MFLYKVDINPFILWASTKAKGKLWYVNHILTMNNQLFLGYA